MASEIRVNSLSSRTGLSTVTFTDTGPIFSGITTFQDNSGFNVGTGGSIFSPASNTVTLGTNSAERLRIDSAGTVIVGTDTTVNPILRILVTSAHNSFIQFADGDSNNVGQLQYSHSSNALIVAVNGGEKLRLDSAGRMLLGTTNAGSNGTADDLVVANNSSASDQAGISIRGGTSGRSQIFFSDGTSGQDEYRGMLRYDHSENSMQFRTDAVERLRITSAGQVIVNGTANLAHPNMDDIIVGDASGNRGITVASGSSGFGTLAFGDSTDGSGNDRYQGFVEYYHNDNSMRLGTVAQERVRINSAGHMGVGNNDPTQAKFVAQTASGMSIAAVKDNTGASISLGGVTQPRILMEAGASASQFKLYTASGSSYSSAGWRQRLQVTDTNASVASTGNGVNGIGCFGIADNSPDSRALALSIGGGNGLYGIEDSRPMVYLQRSYGIGGGSSTDETTLEVNAPGSYNSAGIVYGIKSRAQHNLNGSHYAGHFEAHGSQYSANGTSALYAKTTKLDTNGSGDVIAFRADASITTGVANNGAAIAGYFASGNNINGKPIVCQNGLTSNNWANQIIFRKHNGSNVVQVGSIKSSNTATQYNTNSDYRLKENVISLTGAIDRLKQLQPKRFNFIGVDETIDGFIAHEVTSVAPYAVSGEKDAVKKELVMGEDGKEQFDENGEIIIEEVIDPQSVDYSKLTTLTIAALQEALAKIETLEAKVAVLEG